MFVLPHNPYYVVNPIKREAGKIPYLHGKSILVMTINTRQIR